MIRPEQTIPRRQVIDALRRCPSGLSAAALAMLVYGDDRPSEVNCIHQVVWRLRHTGALAVIGRIETVRDADGFGTYRLIEPGQERVA